MKLAYLYLVVISIVAVVLTIYDKISAKTRAFRISEATLMLCGVFGGAAAEFITMLLIRHKTRHIKFMLGLPIIMFLQIVLFVLVKFILGY